MSQLFTIVARYGGVFSQKNKGFCYSSTLEKVVESVEVEKMHVEEIKGVLGDIVGEYDSLCYLTNGKTEKGGMKVLIDERNRDHMVSVSREKGVIYVYVYHLEASEPNGDDTNVGRADLGEEGGSQKTKPRKRVSKKDTQRSKKEKGKEKEKMSNLNEEIEIEHVNSGMSCSDEELDEIRRLSREQRKELEEIEAENVRRLLFGSVDSGSEDSQCSYSSGSLNSVHSEETDEDDSDVCYAEPPTKGKAKNVGEVFNVKTPAKDIKWVPGLIFADKKIFKNAVRGNSMATGRAYRYLVDDSARIQVACARGCPFKMWVKYVDEIEAWQIVTVVDEHNCVWNYKNKLVTGKFLLELYGDRIRRNPNWKLSDMQDEFKRVLQVDVNEAKCCRLRQKALRTVGERMTDHYAKLRRFGGEILRSNRDNTVKISTTRLQEGDEPRFQRMYICYAKLKMAWKDTCRPILGLDGCFISHVTCEVLSAINIYTF